MSEKEREAPKTVPPEPEIIQKGYVPPKPEPRPPKLPEPDQSTSDELTG